ncbi:exodeoxyribonuclease VII small subunit [Janibacter limosus]|uniref:Exodeoxyribonuclease VII small subunit n=1 Tax=Janibacter limosus TaxID=53458 RepID=A0AC61U5W2_9MICO|nr:exodeoxyribonuclease VII small subunit [Janibacter limosus]UUZ45445.1 exodeoxyribonuclease VII small subunit [Janibacter limosus]
MADEQEQTDVADLGYEEARQELIELVARLEGGRAGLEESMQLWQRGEALAAHCESRLDKAEASLSPDGGPGDRVAAGSEAGSASADG